MNLTLKIHDNKWLILKKWSFIRWRRYKHTLKLTFLGSGHTWWRLTYKVDLMISLSPKGSMTNNFQVTFIWSEYFGIYGVCVSGMVNGIRLSMVVGGNPWISCHKKILSDILVPLHGESITYRMFFSKNIGFIWWKRWKILST